MIADKRKIESFDVKILADYIRRNLFFQNVIDDLIKLEARAECEHVKAEIDKILDKKRELLSGNDPQKIAQWIGGINADSERLDCLWKRQEELKLIIYPEEIEEEKR